MERWDHASLLAAGGSGPLCRSPAKVALPDSQSWCDTQHLSEPESPLDGWEFELVDRRTFRDCEAAAAVRHSGWLLKAYGNGPQRQWRRRFVYITADRLCYTADPDVEGVRYIPLDRIPVRALPRGYGPKLGVTLVEDRQVRGWRGSRLHECGCRCGCPSCFYGPAAQEC